MAEQAPHSSDWLLALPIANCGLRLDDEAERLALGMIIIIIIIIIIIFNAPGSTDPGIKN